MKADDRKGEKIYKLLNEHYGKVLP